MVETNIVLSMKSTHPAGSVDLGLRQPFGLFAHLS